MTKSQFRDPQWITGPRLLGLGEDIQFDFYLPPGVSPSDLVVFPQYLRRAQPHSDFVAGGDLSWLDQLDSQRLPLSFVDGHASLTYQPPAPGNYIARWQAGDAVFYRFFATIEDDWIVLRLSSFIDLDPQPTLHATGIPLDYHLPVERYLPNDPLFQKFLQYHRLHGDAIIPNMPETARMSHEERVTTFRDALQHVRSLLPDANDARSARVEMRALNRYDPAVHDLDPGYTKALMEVGVNDHCGLWCSNGKPWLGMPEFPYYTSPLDCRKMNQSPVGSVVAHQWDFCGGWHFLGPVDIHYAVAKGDWRKTLPCLRAGMEEAKNLAEMNRRPAFLYPLYEAVVDQLYHGQLREYSEGLDGKPMFQFAERYQRQMAFEFTKEYNLAYARSIDICDYYRRHFTQTPRTVFVSRTDHVMYDMWWQNYWCASERSLVTRQTLPWQTGMAHIMAFRRMFPPVRKDPLSCEFILIEDPVRQMRFERECPNPVWWFDYTNQERDGGPQGSSISYVEIPDVEVIRSDWLPDEEGITIKLRMQTAHRIDDYAVALWGLSPSFTGDPSQVRTTAKECILSRNVDGEFHAVLIFDLKPDAELRLTLLHDPVTPSGRPGDPHLLP